MTVSIRSTPTRIESQVADDLDPEGSISGFGNSLRLERFAPEDIAVCSPDQLELIVGDQTRVIGIRADNPLGIALTTGIYPAFYGREIEAINAV